MPAGVDNVVVLLDAHEAWRTLDDDLEIWWGAFVGLDREVLVSGRLGDVRDDIAAQRDAAKPEAGWLFDTYLLRRVEDRRCRRRPSPAPPTPVRSRTRWPPSPTWPWSCRPPAARPLPRTQAAARGACRSVATGKGGS